MRMKSSVVFIVGSDFIWRRPWGFPYLIALLKITESLVKNNKGAGTFVLLRTTSKMAGQPELQLKEQAGKKPKVPSWDPIKPWELGHLHTCPRMYLLRIKQNKTRLGLINISSSEHRSINKGQKPHSLKYNFWPSTGWTKSHSDPRENTIKPGFKIKSHDPSSLKDNMHVQGCTLVAVIRKESD